MMEMLNAGLLQAIVVDDWKARMWAQVLPKIKVNDGAAVREGGKIGWAIRKNSPKLSAELNEFYTSSVKKQGVVDMRMKRVLRAGSSSSRTRPGRRRRSASRTPSRSSASTGASIASTR